MPAINPKEMIEQKKREAVAKKKPATAATAGAAKTTKKAAPPKPRVKKEKKPTGPIQKQKHELSSTFSLLSKVCQSVSLLV